MADRTHPVSHSNQLLNTGRSVYILVFFNQIKSNLLKAEGPSWALTLP